MRDLNLNINIDKSSNVKRVVNLNEKDKKSDGDQIGCRFNGYWENCKN